MGVLNLPLRITSRHGSRRAFPPDVDHVLIDRYTRWVADRNGDTGLRELQELAHAANEAPRLHGAIVHLLACEKRDPKLCDLCAKVGHVVSEYEDGPQ